MNVRKMAGMAVAAVAMLLVAAGGAMADTFGTGANQFTIDFVPISGATNPTSGYGIVNNDYRMGTYEITNDQWNKFKASLGVPVTGNPSDAYDYDPYFTGTNVPTNNVSWYEAAQFVNWLNTSTGHQAAYKFTGTQGTSDYTLATWSTAEADNGTNLYRHKDAYYFLPTEDEWVKAAYWNGTSAPDLRDEGGRESDAGQRHERHGLELLQQRICHRSLWPLGCRQRQPGTQRHVRHDGQCLGMDGKPVLQRTTTEPLPFAGCVAGRTATTAATTSRPPTGATTTRTTSTTMSGSVSPPKFLNLRVWGCSHWAAWPSFAASAATECERC